LSFSKYLLISMNEVAGKKLADYERELIEEFIK
jgi:hypothetical protein